MAQGKTHRWIIIQDGEAVGGTDDQDLADAIEEEDGDFGVVDTASLRSTLTYKDLDLEDPSEDEDGDD